jgi:hypothetical protein
MNVRVYRNADDPKELIIGSETADASQEIRSAMQEADVVGPPKVHVMP